MKIAVLLRLVPAAQLLGSARLARRRAALLELRASGGDGLRWQPVSALRSFGKDRTAAPGSAAGRFHRRVVILIFFRIRVCGRGKLSGVVNSDYLVGKNYRFGAIVDEKKKGLESAGYCSPPAIRAHSLIQQRPTHRERDGSFGPRKKTAPIPSEGLSDQRAKAYLARFCFEISGFREGLPIPVGSSNPSDDQWPFLF